jgi:hypothetical protein
MTPGSKQESRVGRGEMTAAANDDRTTGDDKRRRNNGGDGNGDYHGEATGRDNGGCRGGRLKKAAEGERGTREG